MALPMIIIHNFYIYVLLIPRLLGRYSKYPKECEIIPRAQPEGLSHIPEGVCKMLAVGVV